MVKRKREAARVAESDNVKEQLELTTRQLKATIREDDLVEVEKSTGR